MASKLTKRDINILDANNFDIVGNKPYEDGKWGSHADRDFVHFQIYDSNNKLNIPFFPEISSSALTTINKLYFMFFLL